MQFQFHLIDQCVICLHSKMKFIRFKMFRIGVPVALTSVCTTFIHFANSTLMESELSKFVVSLFCLNCFGLSEIWRILGVCVCFLCITGEFLYNFIVCSFFVGKLVKQLSQNFQMLILLMFLAVFFF